MEKSKTRKGPDRGAPRKRPDELRERATRLAVEARKDPAVRADAIKHRADQFDVHPETLRGWVKQAETDEGIAPEATSAEAVRMGVVEGRGVDQRHLAVDRQAAPGSVFASSSITEGSLPAPARHAPEA